MNKKIIALIASSILGITCFIFYSFTKCHSQILEIHSFNQVNFYAIAADTLVIFDVDETLIKPVDNYVLNEHTSEVKEFRQRTFTKFPKEEQDLFHGIMLNEAARPLIESYIIDKINNLKDLGITVIACTAMKTGKKATFNRFEVWRYNQLKSVGFEGSFNNLDFELQGFKSKPVFYRGILAVDQETKGSVIGAFLDHMHLHPKKIIMFDDTADYLKTVQNECCKRKIEFVGYNYLGGDYTVPWDQELSQFQADYLIEHHHWLPDAQARKLMHQSRKMTPVAVEP